MGNGDALKNLIGFCKSLTVRSRVRDHNSDERGERVGLPPLPGPLEGAVALGIVQGNAAVTLARLLHLLGPAHLLRRTH